MRIGIATIPAVAVATQMIKAIPVQKNAMPRAINTNVSMSPPFHITDKCDHAEYNKPCNN